MSSPFLSVLTFIFLLPFLYLCTSIFDLFKGSNNKFLSLHLGTEKGRLRMLELFIKTSTVSPQN